MPMEIGSRSGAKGSYLLFVEGNQVILRRTVQFYVRLENDPKHPILTPFGDKDLTSLAARLGWLVCFQDDFVWVNSRPTSTPSEKIFFCHRGRPFFLV